MFLVLFVFTFVFIPPVASAKWDPFTFDYEITCRYHVKPMYWYSIKFYENDVFVSGEWITQTFEEKFAPGTIRRIFRGAMDGDEFLSDGYSIMAFLKHDCTANGDVVEIRTQFEKLCEIGKPCYKQHNIDITDQKGYMLKIST